MIASICHFPNWHNSVAPPDATYYTRTTRSWSCLFANGQTNSVNLSAFQPWSSSSLNDLELCVDKCVFFTFARIRCPLVYDYALNGSTIERKCCVRDLRILLDEKLSFHNQLEQGFTKGNDLIDWAGLVVQSSTRTT